MIINSFRLRLPRKLVQRGSTGQLNHTLCVRRGLWRIYWSSSERSYHVEALKNKHLIKVDLTKDPFAGILENDIDLVMEEVMYLKSCWQYEMRISKDIASSRSYT